MKRGLLVAFLLLLLLAAGALAPVFKTDPGQVVINFGGWTLETSVLVLVGALLLAWLGLQIVTWLWRKPVTTARRLSEQRAIRQLEKGLLALTEGDWKTAEKALEKSAGKHGKTTARYLAAAQAAEGQDAGERREYYLEQADSGGGKKRFLVQLTRARMLLANGESAAALPVLKDLNKRRRRHPQVLELLTRCYRDLRQWDELQALLPALQKADILDQEEIGEVETEVAVNRLRNASDAEELQSVWKSFHRPMRAHTSVIDAFAGAAARLEQPELAEPVLVHALKHTWAPSLLLRYGDPNVTDRSKRMKQCEKWLKQHPDDAALHLALGRLCAGESIWGKAREHVVRSIELEPSSMGYDSLGQLLERQGEMELATACFRNALRMSQGQVPQPLPAISARLSAPQT